MDTLFQSTSQIIAKNADSFHRLLGKLGPHSEEQLNDVATGLALRLWKEISARTPVDKGRARANWQLGSSVKPGTIDSGFSKNESPVPDEAAVAEMAASDRKWIFNNLPYIERLEAGSSSQAPSGMVAESLAMVNSHLEDELRRIGK